MPLIREDNTSQICVIMRVLIVDDNAGMRCMLKCFLADIFDEFDEAGDGAAAVRSYASSKADVVLMDLRMPILNGYRATRKILDMDRTAKIVVVSDHDEDPSRNEAEYLGVSEFFSKADLCRLREYLHEIVQSGSVCGDD